MSPGRCPPRPRPSPASGRREPRVRAGSGRSPRRMNRRPRDARATTARPRSERHSLTHSSHSYDGFNAENSSVVPDPQLSVSVHVLGTVGGSLARSGHRHEVSVLAPVWLAAALKTGAAYVPLRAVRAVDAGGGNRATDRCGATLRVSRVQTPSTWR